MTDFDYIPLTQVYMKNGVNIGGFQYRQYQTDGVWELHLHAGGGIVRLHHRQMGQVFYIPTSSIESCDGFSNSVRNGLPPSESPVSEFSSQVAGPLPLPYPSGTHNNGGLIPNQIAHKVEAPAIVTIDGPELLEPASNLSPEQKAAKAAHFKPVTPEPEPLVSAPAESKSPNAYKSLAVPKPARRKPGRPRKVMVDTTDPSNVTTNP